MAEAGSARCRSCDSARIDHERFETFGAEAKGNVITLRLGRSDIPFDRDVDDQAWTIRHPF